MQHALAFDTLAYAKKSKSAGFTEKQTEIKAETLAELIDEKLSTKKDLKELEASLKRDMKELETALQRDIEEIKFNMKELETSLRRDMNELKLELKRDMKDLEVRLLIRLGIILTAGIGIISTLVVLLR